MTLFLRKIVQFYHVIALFVTIQLNAL